MSAILQNPVFRDETKAREWLEARVWPNGPICPHCGNADAARIRKMDGEKHRPGLYQCNECREQFTVTVGTVFERSKIPLTKWLAALFLMVSSKKGISAHQIHRMLGITYKSAWFLCHRLREAMRDGKLSPIGGEGKTIEADETYFGNSGKTGFTYVLTPEGWEKVGLGGGGQARMKVMSLVERGGEVRSVQVDFLTANTAARILAKHADPRSILNTDESNIYTKLGKSFALHETVNHSQKEYGRGSAYTNTIEGYFSIFKRGMKGVYQHCSEKHLHRYLAEFDFRYNNRVALGCNDLMHAEKLAIGISGKRLTYRRTNESVV